MYEILSNLPENIAYTCINCTDQHPAEWRTALGKELQGSVRLVLTALLNSRTTTHLLRYRQVSQAHALHTWSNRDICDPHVTSFSYPDLFCEIPLTSPGPLRATFLCPSLQAVKPPELNPETEESIPSRSSPEGPDPPVLTEVSPQHEAPLDMEGVKRKMEQGGYTSVVSTCNPIGPT